MSEEEHTAEYNAALHAQLRLFCHLMLGSADAAECVIQQVHQRALDHHDENGSSERDQLFRIAADLCGVDRPSRNRNCCPGDDIGERA